MTNLSWLDGAAVTQLTDAGLDLVIPFDIAAYHVEIASHPSLKRLLTFGREHATALLIGNTRALWPALKDAVAANPELLSIDPVDRHVEATLERFANSLADRTEIYLGHHGGSRLVSMLHVAEASGFAHRGPAHLAVHPEHGSWFALRAVIVVDRAWDGTVTPAPDICSGCSAPCLEALNTAISRQRSLPVGPGMGPSWRDWVRVRDVCPVGVAARYSEAQLRYHYTLDLSLVRGG